MSALHAEMHPHAGCMAGNAVHMCWLSCHFRYLSTEDEPCVQGFFHTLIELDLTDVNL